MAAACLSPISLCPFVMPTTEAGSDDELTCVYERVCVYQDDVRFAYLPLGCFHFEKQHSGKFQLRFPALHATEPTTATKGGREEASLTRKAARLPHEQSGTKSSLYLLQQHSSLLQHASILLVTSEDLTGLTKCAVHRRQVLVTFSARHGRS
jgi:hypothetical protein